MKTILMQGGLGVCTLLILLLPPSHLGNTSYTSQAASLKSSTFVPSIPNLNTYERIIDVDISELSLVLREQSGGEICRYPIAGPKQKEIPKPLIKKGQLFGNVHRVIIDPWWYPTFDTRQEGQAKGRELPERIAPGSPLNAMGKAKIIIKFEDCSEPLRIHGTNQPGSIGRHASRGCIRMHNRDILQLAGLLQGKKSAVLFRYGHADAKASNQPVPKNLAKDI